MNNLAHDLQEMAYVIDVYGLHTGEQMAHVGTVITFDISALAYVIAEDAVPNVLFTDEVAAIRLIESSARAMACIRAISAAINDYEVPDSAGRPDVIEHVSNWAATPGIGATKPPSTSEVIGCILRARNAATHTPAA